MIIPTHLDQKGYKALMGFSNKITEHNIRFAVNKDYIQKLRKQGEKEIIILIPEKGPWTWLKKG